MARSTNHLSLVADTLFASAIHLTR